MRPRQRRSFYPLIEDPYDTGRIACANVLSDLYAMGITQCDNMLMLLGICRELVGDVRRTVTRMMMRGFEDQCRVAGTRVTGGQTVVNPWFIIGGVASSVCARNEFILPTGAEVGDAIVLTKALGTQVAVNVRQWLDQRSAQWSALSATCTEQLARRMYGQATALMRRLNRVAAECMHTYGAHAATDVTGFGIFGHADNLARYQKQPVTLRIHTLPCIAGTVACDAALDRMFRLLAGHSAETSGGLLVVLPAERAADYCRAVQERDRCPAWIVGEVVTGNRCAIVDPSPRIIEVDLESE